MTTEEIKSVYSMKDILSRYGLLANLKGFISCPFHKEHTASMKIYKDSFHCFGCGANGDIFSFVMRMDNLSFKDAFRELGGSYQDKEKMSFTSYMNLTSAVNKRKTARIREHRVKLNSQLNNMLIAVYRRWLHKSEPLSDVWCSCYNALQYQIYISECLNETR